MQRWPTHLCTVSPVDVRPAVPVDMFLLWYPFCAKKTTYNLRFSIASSTAFGKPLDTVLWLLSTGRSLLSASSRCCASRHASLTGLVSTQSGTFLRRVCAKNVRVRPHLAASGAGKRVNLVTRMFGELLDCLALQELVTSRFCRTWAKNNWWALRVRQNRLGQTNTF